MQQKSKNRRPLIIAVTILLVLVIAFLAIWLINREKPVDGLKNITVTVVLPEGSPNVHEIKTEREYLADALLDEGIIEGSDGEWGFFITTVDGVAVDDSLEQWWMLTKGGEMTATGASEIVLADGNSYELTLAEGFE